MANVLVLGGDGMLGRAISDVLATGGIEVASAGRRRDREDSFFLDAEEGPEPLRRLLRERGPFDYIINCIGVLSHHIRPDRPDTVRSALLINALFPHFVAELAAETSARVIHVSSDGVFAPNAGLCREDTPISCADPYGQTKALGEVASATVLNIRCSLIGPDPVAGKGLLEWFRRQQPDAEVGGYTDHLWNGVTTLQFAQLCEKLIRGALFDVVRDEGETHHFCPNETISKYGLLLLLRETLRPDVTVIPVKGPGAPVDRVLDTRCNGLRRIFGTGIPMRSAVSDLTRFTG